METGELDEFRRLLSDERARLQSAVDHIQAEPSGGIEDEPGEVGGRTESHLGGAASATFDRELDEGLADGAKQTLVDIDAATARIESGEFGFCEVCGKPIGADRLRVIPWARLCIDDQRRVG